jgi:hypothetical protein
MSEFNVFSLHFGCNLLPEEMDLHGLLFVGKFEDLLGE